MSKPLRPSELRHLNQSSKLANVLYEIRGPVNAEAERMAADGHRILKLNTGNPAEFGFEAPDVIMRDMISALPHAQGYSTSKGIISARRAIVARYEVIPGFPEFDVEDVFLGNGVSELITMTMQALLDDGDEVLIPSPDYPLWTASTSLSGGKPVHYLCDEEDNWNPSIEDIRSKVTERTKAIVVINPNNPTGAVYSKEILQQIVDVAREHSLLILADEIYDKILYDDAKHINIASLCPDLLCLTFNGLSKAYRVAGYRSGWMVITGPKGHAEGFLEGLTMLAGTRLCPNVPAQHAIQVAISGRQSIDGLVLPGGRLLEQRNMAWEKLNEIPGVSCVKPMGALYAFPKLDPNVHEIHDDEKLMFDLLRAEKIHLVQGTGFNWPTPDHFRMVTLPWARDIKDAIERLGNFLASYRQ
ncbi:pyridoxal phosphate-dependent aminotransferase [Corynebacterium urealyticum]|uniref:Alanine aminotransferase n=1 Tax=Corynebacterium urealyticum (strain ATCC 43042 / DSM 7109) TaxID=504474 RepID=B1VHZ4_CORU7|nr:pyridoxal phosphate-dependent aminotransferase [Corynebacterium urealyticum]AGE37351.1 alanine aminotransferase [Corynebacterium urealyticum DSM 7111]CAQ05794.1 alanine aminotransferase [Corynebacterium urealyticum DSM 7109]SNV91358.1 alanine aminotransferase [Corynebacterium urealyticum]